jgi:hypothetical protein
MIDTVLCMADSIAYSTLLHCACFVGAKVHDAYILRYQHICSTVSVSVDYYNLLLLAPLHYSMHAGCCFRTYVSQVRRTARLEERAVPHHMIGGIGSGGMSLVTGFTDGVQGMLMNPIRYGSNNIK